MNPVNSETPPKDWIEWACQFVMENWGLVVVLLLFLVISACALRKIESSIKKYGKFVLDSLKTYPWSSSLTVLIGFLIVARLLYQSIPLDDFWAVMRFAVEIIIAVVALVFFYRRLRNQDRQVAHQIRKETDDRFTTAVNLLGSAEASARTGAIYSLYQLFMDKKGKKYRRQIARILSSHIRTKTQEKKYQKKHKDRPSNEIQTTIDLLFRLVDDEMGIYYRDKFSGRYGISAANLKHAFLCGANFGSSCCEKASFEKADIRGADFWGASCKLSNFRDAHCEGTNFNIVHCEGADFTLAYCMGANFQGAHCEGANFSVAHCEGAVFQDAHCTATNFSCASCQGTDFWKADFRGSYTSDKGLSYLFGAERIKKRIGRKTELEDVIFTGKVMEQIIKAIDKAKSHLEKSLYLPRLGVSFYDHLQRIVERNEKKGVDHTTPESMITGKLEDNPELQEIIQELEKIDSRISKIS